MAYDETNDSDQEKTTEGKVEGTIKAVTGLAK